MLIPPQAWSFAESGGQIAIIEIGSNSNPATGSPPPARKASSRHSLQRDTVLCPQAHPFAADEVAFCRRSLDRDSDLSEMLAACHMREGAMVDDIILDRQGCRPYIHIAANQQRRIKNPQSKRNIPFHPELIRLSFPAYVMAIKALGHKLLFPDLYSPSSRSPLGNRFYKLFRPILTAAKITEEGLGSHAVRHLFGAQLKKKLLSKEDRADLLGHGGDSETSERYCEPHELDTLLDFVMKLDVVTGQLEPRGTNLIPWVAKREVAPFSQPSRAKREAKSTVGIA
jgi:hypothetical protein